MFRNFSWLIENEIAGMARPISLIDDFEYLKKNDIDAIISLTEQPLQKSLIEEFGFEYVHLPILDFRVPTFEQIDEFIRFVQRLRAQRKKIVIHCDSGMGRTGTMLSIYLVGAKGYSAKDAILEVREKRPGSIETIEQERIIYEFEKKSCSGS